MLASTTSSYLRFAPSLVRMPHITLVTSIALTTYHVTGAHAVTELTL